MKPAVVAAVLGRSGAEMQSSRNCHMGAQRRAALPAAAAAAATTEAKCGSSFIGSSVSGCRGLATAADTATTNALQGHQQRVDANAMGQAVSTASERHQER
jgi:hypothetical protein